MLDPYSDETLVNPAPFWERLRAEAPVFEVPGSPHHFLVSRYQDIQTVTADPENFSNAMAGSVQRGPDGRPCLFPNPSGKSPQGQVLGAADGDTHRRHRKLLAGSFSARRIKIFEDWLAQRAAELLRAAGTSFDLMEAVSAPLPVFAIARLIGLPEADWKDCRRGATAAMTLMGGLAFPNELPTIMGDVGALEAYLEEHLNKRRSGETQGEEDDVLSLVGAALDRGEIEIWEAKGLLFQLVVGGSDTTVALIAATVRYLAEQPEWQDRLRADRSGVPAFVEESLRLDGPAIGNLRHVRTACELGGVPIPEGATLTLLWGSANRDEALFEDPDRFDPDRANLKRNVGFGNGIHLCLGATLARLETISVVNALLDLDARIELGCDPAELRMASTLVIRKLQALPVRLVPRG